jgi:hypothetical protein
LLNLLVFLEVILHAFLVLLQLGANPTEYALRLLGADPTPYVLRLLGANPTPYVLRLFGTDPTEVAWLAGVLDSCSFD